MLFQESIQSYPQRRTRGIRCHFFLWAVIEPVVVNNDKWPEADEIPKHITTSRLSRVLMYCSTCQPTHTSSFTLWQLSEGFLSFGSITHNCTHFRTRLWGWCSVRAPTAWASVPPPGTSACGAACGICDSTGLSEHSRKGNYGTGGMFVPVLSFQRDVGNCRTWAWHREACFVHPTILL